MCGSGEGDYLTGKVYFNSIRRQFTFLSRLALFSFCGAAKIVFFSIGWYDLVKKESESHSISTIDRGIVHSLCSLGLKKSIRVTYGVCRRMTAKIRQMSLNLMAFCTQPPDLPSAFLRCQYFCIP